MPSSLVLRATTLALVCASTASATLKYVLQDNYEGETFFENLDFFAVRSSLHAFCEDYLNICAGQGSIIWIRQLPKP